MEILKGGMLGRRPKSVRIDHALEFECPVCGAKRGERCHVQPGVISFESHPGRIPNTGSKIARFFEGRMVPMICRSDFPTGWDAA